VIILATATNGCAGFTVAIVGLGLVEMVIKGSGRTISATDPQVKELSLQWGICMSSVTDPHVKASWSYLGTDTHSTQRRSINGL
jgi:hypothetical protein